MNDDNFWRSEEGQWSLLYLGTVAIFFIFWLDAFIRILAA